jgi:hypothetical protein
MATSSISSSHRSAAVVTLSQWQGRPTALRIALGGHLRQLREASGITRNAAGKAIRASSSKISRLELGRVAFKERDVASPSTASPTPRNAKRFSLSPPSRTGLHHC